MQSILFIIINRFCADRIWKISFGKKTEVGLEEGRLSWFPDKQELAVRTSQGWRPIQVTLFIYLFIFYSFIQSSFLFRVMLSIIFYSFNIINIFVLPIQVFLWISFFHSFHIIHLFLQTFILPYIPLSQPDLPLGRLAGGTGKGCSKRIALNPQNHSFTHSFIHSPVLILYSFRDLNLFIILEI